MSAGVTMALFGRIEWKEATGKKQESCLLRKDVIGSRCWETFYQGEVRGGVRRKKNMEIKERGQTPDERAGILFLARGIKRDGRGARELPGTRRTKGSYKPAGIDSNKRF